MTGTNPRHRTAAELAGHDGFSLISNQKLLQLYAGLVQCRLLQERLRTLLPQSKLTGRGAGVTGQEAAIVATAVDLLPQDSIAPSGCDLLLHLIQGKPLGNLLTHLSVRDSQPNHAPSLHTAVGTALAHETAKNGRIVLVFRGEEDDSSNLWEESLHVAGVHRLPMLFVRPSPLPTDPMRTRKLTGAVNTPRTAGAGAFPRIPVDGYDVVAVYRVATEAIAHARKGSGPTLIECQSELSNSASGRSTGSGKSDDPILNMEAYLTRKDLFNVELKRECVAGFIQKLDAAFRTAAKSHPLLFKSNGGTALRQR